MIRMDYTTLPSELDELILCSCCHLPFNETDALPKLFSCRHYFCLKCINQVLMKGNELYCIHCWKRTELSGPDMKPDNLPTYNAILYLSQNLNMITTMGTSKKPPDKLLQNNNNNNNSNSINLNNTASSAAVNASVNATKFRNKGENCLTHAMPNALWCHKCNVLLCRACAGADEHRNHNVKTQAEARDQIRTDIASDLLVMQKSLSELQHFVFKQRDFLLKILEACTALKTQVETELINHLPTFEVAEIRSNLTKAKLFLNMLEQQSPLEAHRLYANLNIEKQRLQSKYQEMYLQCKLDDLIQHYGVLFDFDLIKQALSNLNTIDPIALSGGAASSNSIIGHHNSILLLANYCISQLYSRHILTAKHHQQIESTSLGYGTVSSPAQLTAHQSPKINHHQSSSSQLNESGLLIGQQSHLTKSYVSELMNGAACGAAGPSNSSAATTISVPISIMQHLHQHSSQSVASSPTSQASTSVTATSLMCNPSVHVYPIYFFNIEINGQPFGRILIEVRNDVAPKMAKNFGALCTGELGFGYKGCTIFQCWENESIITGDFELNNGRGGRSVFEEGFFMPDDTKILAIRGSVGMRRSQKRHDNMGLVGSQFRIILREMRGFTGIFAFVVEGLELVEKISQAGDSAGKPQSNVLIVNCGKWQ